MKVETKGLHFTVSGYTSREYNLMKEIGGKYNRVTKNMYFPLNKSHVLDFVDLFNGQFSYLLDGFEYKNTVTDEDLYPHQRVGIDFLLRGSRGSLLAFDPGLGKTMTAIRAANKLGLRKILVVCPNILFFNWSDEIQKFDQLSLPTQIIKTKKTGIVEGWNIIGFGKLHYPQMAQDWDLIIVDESHAIKSRKSKRSLNLADLALRAAYRWSLTGTPISKDVSDLWANFRFTHPGVFTSYWRFVNRHCYVVDTPWAKEIKGSKNIDFVDRFSDIMLIRNYKQAGIELPDVLHETVKVELSRVQKRMYKEVKSEFGVYLKNGEEIKADTALTRLLRLQQITSFAGNIDSDFSDSSKIDALVNLVQADKVKFPLLVWSNWPETLKEAKKRLPVDCGLIIGDTPNDDRESIIKDFKDGKFPVLLMSLGCGTYGLNLQNVMTNCYLDKSFSFTEYKQSFARVRRIGLDHTTYNLSIVAENTVDDKIIENLLGKSIEFENLSGQELKELIECL